MRIQTEEKGKQMNGEVLQNKGCKVLEAITGKDVISWRDWRRCDSNKAT